MNHGANKNSPDVGTVYQPNCLDPRLSSNCGPGIKPTTPAALNGGDQGGAKLEWAKDVLAQVIRTIGENPDAPFATAALQAAALIEQHDLATFARYRRNLKQGHISITVLDAGLQRLKTRPRAMARLAAAARPAVARPAPAAASSALAHPGRGRELKLPEPQPWPAPVAGARLLNELSTTIRKHLVMTVEAAHAVALWVLFTYLLDVFETSPRLAITSTQKRCGKTTLLSLLYQLTCRPLTAANLTPGVACRVIEAARPTLLLDETDTVVKENDDLRGVLNSGHSRATAFVIRCQSEYSQPRCFSTWAAIALAGSGKLPETLADCSIEIKLKRMTNRQTAQRLNRNSRAPLSELARKIARWAIDHEAQVESAEPTLPTSLDERAADNWRPLLALADTAGGHWPRLARAAAVALEREPR